MRKPYNYDEMLFIHDFCLANTSHNPYPTTSQKTPEVAPLKINESLQFNEELMIKLPNFTHKYPYNREVTKAIAET